MREPVRAATTIRLRSDHPEVQTWSNCHARSLLDSTRMPTDRPERHPLCARRNTLVKGLFDDSPRPMLRRTSFERELDISLAKGKSTRNANGLASGYRSATRSSASSLQQSPSIAMVSHAYNPNAASYLRAAFRGRISRPQRRCHLHAMLLIAKRIGDVPIVRTVVLRDVRTTLHLATVGITVVPARRWHRWPHPRPRHLLSQRLVRVGPRCLECSCEIRLARPAEHVNGLAATQVPERPMSRRP